MKLTKKYLKIVERNLPTKIRKEVSKELEDLIKQEIDNGRNEKEVLNEFGNPKDVAKNYVPNLKYLIGPELREIYFTILIIILLVAGIGITIANVVKFVAGNIMWYNALFETIGNLVSVVISVFGSITLIFFLINKTMDEDDINIDSRKWSVDELEKVKISNQEINLFETVVSILISIFLLVLILFDYNNTNNILINFDIIERYRWLILTVFSLNIVFDFSLLIKRLWMNYLRIIKIILEIFTSGAIIFIMTRRQFFNNSVLDDLKKISEIIPQIINNVLYVAVLIIVILTIIEIIKHTKQIIKKES